MAGSYNVWRKVDNGSWSIWLNNAPDTAAAHVGAHGHTYHFEALNIDNAGNIEIRLGNAEANTVVDTTYGPSYLSGDANNNGEVNGLDVVYLVNYLKGMGPAPNPLLAADANGSCDVNGVDVTYLVNYLKGLGEEPVMGDCR